MHFAHSSQRHLQQISTYCDARVCQALSVDPNNSVYQSYRSNTKMALEIGSVAIGGYGAAKGAYSALKSARGALALKEMGVVGRMVTKGGVNQTTSKISSFVKEIFQPNPLKGACYTPKVIKDMRLNAKTAQPDFHGFPRIVDNLAGFGRVESLLGRDGITRTKVSLSGGYQGREGCFEWILESDKTINHRLFVPNQ